VRLLLAGYVTVTLMTFDKQLDARQIKIELKLNGSKTSQMTATKLHVVHS